MLERIVGVHALQQLLGRVEVARLATLVGRSGGGNGRHQANHQHHGKKRDEAPPPVEASHVHGSFPFSSAWWRHTHVNPTDQNPNPGRNLLGQLWGREDHLEVALSDLDKAELLAYVGADFSQPADKTRVEGAVVEHLWASIAEALDGGWGRPLLVVRASIQGPVTEVGHRLVEILAN